MTKRIPISLAIVLAAGGCFGQTPTINHVSMYEPSARQRHVYSRTDELQQIIDKLDREKLRPVVPGSWEGQVLSAAQECARQSLRVNLGDTNTAELYTLPASDGDTLVARWASGDVSRPETAIWLWDTPFYTTFVMEMNPNILEPDIFTRYCEGLFLWGKFIHLKTLKLAYLDPENDRKWVLGAGDYEPTSQGSYHMWFMATSSKSTAYVAVGMSKPIFSDKYPSEAYQVPERFPPLRLRLTSVPRQALFGELGKGFGARGIGVYPTNRDTIVVGELLSRGPLSEAEIREIVIGSFDKGDYQSAMLIIDRLSAFLQAVNRHHELATYASALERIFLTVPIHRNAQGAVIGHVFGSMERHQVNFSHAALSFLARDRFSSSSLRYLENNVRDAQTLQRLAEIGVKPELEEAKRAALKKIEGRLIR